jgi:signal transduction histidine kinase
LPDDADYKVRFADLVAHELRTPVQAMQGYLEAARLREPELVSLLQDQLDRLSRVIGALAEADGGPAQLGFAPADLAVLAREAVEELAARRPDRKLVFQSNGALPVRGNHERLSQAVHDLLDNALKFSPGRQQVALTAFADGKRCGVRVVDQGIGVPAAEIAQLGQRWFRASNADPRMYPGLGLGLAMASETARLHGGTLRFESELKRGTSAVFELPLQGG